MSLPLTPKLTARNLIAEQVLFNETNEYYMHIIIQTSKFKGQINYGIDKLPPVITANILDDISSEFLVRQKAHS